MRYIVILVVVLSFFMFDRAWSLTPLENGQELFLKGEYDACIKACQDNLTRGGNSAEANELRYLMALSYLKLSDFDNAEKTFQELLARRISSGLAQKAHLGLSNTYFLGGDIDKAVNGFRSFLTRYPASSLTPSCYLNLAKALMKKGDWKEAKFYLREVRDKYPLSLEAPEANQILKTDEFYFTIQVGSFKSRSNAERIEAELKEDNFPAYISRQKVEDEMFYRVRVGKFADLNEALMVERRLNARRYSTKMYP